MQLELLAVFNSFGLKDNKIHKLIFISFKGKYFDSVNIYIWITVGIKLSSRLSFFYLSSKHDEQVCKKNGNHLVIMKKI